MTKQKMRTFAGAGRPRSRLSCDTVSTLSPTAWTRSTSPRGTTTGINKHRKRRLAVTVRVARGTTNRRRRRCHRHEAIVTRSINHTAINIKRVTIKNATTRTPTIPKSPVVVNSIGTTSSPWNQKDAIIQSWTLTPHHRSSSSTTRGLI